MEKPFILVQNEMREELNTLVNKYTASVPVMNIIDALVSLTNVLTPMAESQLKQTRMQYEKAVKENKTDEKTN